MAGRVTDANGLKRLLRAGVETGVFPGAVAAVGGSTGIERRLAVGSADPTSDTPMTTGTLFDVASLTKPIVTTTVALRLVERGTLAFDDPLARHVPRFEDTPRGAIEIGHLLTHTAGLEPYAYDPEWTTLEGTLAGLADRSLLTAVPGETHEYSCLGYVYLAEVLRRVADASLASLARRHVFDPAGMSTAELGPVDPVGRSVAATRDHEYGRGVLRGAIHDPLAHATGGESGNAGLVASVDDLTAFARALLNDGGPLLAPTSVASLAEDRCPVADEVHGLGWRLATDREPASNWSDRAVGHTGYTGTSLWIDLDRERFAALLTNQVFEGKDTGLDRFRERFHGLVGAGRY